ncbi:hypothetical protein DSL72_005064 [Monilinia vaccinii-corymbosi]|uniref:Uncharacterized protein n=1 Tax=Monilinia vaccinii-corymbosi TaxID=61207 RepID=A0A8A3PEN0_9HELO|nr:hypothetical protein DSL72_005064 [Monilinia vaccinii-corymbosi]
MRSFFSRSPDLEGGRTYKKGFTGDHRGRTHIPPNPSPLFSPQSQLSPFGAPSAVYRHDTIFKPPSSPSPKSVVFSDRSWSAREGAAGVGVASGTASGTVSGIQGNGSGNGNTGAAAALDKEHLDRLNEYLGVLPSGNVPPRGRRGFSLSHPNDRPLHSTPPIPLSPQARAKKTLKQKAAEQQFRTKHLQGQSHHSYDALLGEEESRVRYQKHVFREALRTALSMQRGEDQEGDEEREREEERERDAKVSELGEGGRGPGMQRRGANEGVREGGFVGPSPVVVEEELWPNDLGEFLEKYDPRSDDLPDVYPMGEHRAMLRTMYLEDILHSTAKLHKHNWILLSRNEKYKDLRVPERWDQIQEDLEKYTRSIRNYEYWLTSFIPHLELSKASLPPRFHLYGKQLAILEVAHHFSHPSESALANELERKLLAYHTDWSVSNGVWRNIKWETRSKGWRSGSAGVAFLGRLLGAVLGGGCVIAPVCVLVLWPGGVNRAGGVGVVGVSVAIVGALVVWGTGGKERKRDWDKIEGAREIESGRERFGGEWGMRDVMFFLAAYAAVLVVFLGIAVV